MYSQKCGFMMSACIHTKVCFRSELLWCNRPPEVEHPIAWESRDCQTGHWWPSPPFPGFQLDYADIRSSLVVQALAWWLWNSHGTYWNTLQQQFSSNCSTQQNPFLTNIQNFSYYSFRLNHEENQWATYLHRVWAEYVYSRAATLLNISMRGVT